MFKLPDLARLRAGDPVPLIPDSSLDLRMLTLADLSVVVDFRRMIIDSLENPDFIYPEPDEAEAAAAVLDQDGITFGVFAGDRLVAYSPICMPRAADRFGKLGPSAAIARFCDLGEAAYMVANLVDPAYRGRGIASALVELKFRIAPAFGRGHRFGLCSTANGIALHNQLKFYAVADVLHLQDINFGTLTRFLTYCPPTPVRFHGPTTWAESTDEPTQSRLLGAGLRGAYCRRSGDGFEVGYRSFD